MAKHYPKAVYSPEMYGWVDTDETMNVKKIVCKQVLNNPKEDYVLVGTFTFKKAKYFLNSAELSIASEEKVNGEYYVDSVINKAIEIGLKVALFEIDYFICWGTPDELEIYNYWESCFNEWKDHPYKNLNLNK